MLANVLCVLLGLVAYAQAGGKCSFTLTSYTEDTCTTAAADAYVMTADSEKIGKCIDKNLFITVCDPDIYVIIDQFDNTDCDGDFTGTFAFTTDSCLALDLDGTDDGAYAR